MKKKLYRDIKLKSGVTLAKGTYVDVFPIKDSVRGVQVILPNGNEHKLSYASVFKPPSEACLNRWCVDSIVESVTGENVEPDGYDDQGFPSWLLALGLI